ncbi:MAG TPA: 30S ribosomal protein S3 [Candidatus Paceibacterota bacterium]|nr:30S ribosomal protein S3 [Candidatus Pacearchaeota archaeon]HRZ50953.1 30S ribosomal protein S3 [Candidatus Paceibacterota bacterium]HSA36674.1 30S ribosomal protein S3 [Candidatus Paceibacterota bacterium]
MAHKVHPKAFRIKGIANWYSRGFYEKNFPSMLEEDYKIRTFLQKRLAKIGISEIEIERYANKLNILIFCVRPGLIIGRQGQGIEELKKKLEKEIFKGKKTGHDLRVEIREITNPWASAEYVGQSVAVQIEKRMPYLKILKQSLEKIMASKEVGGARIQVSGRLNGVEIARTAWLSKGRLPRQTIRADINYALTEAHCTYGKIGIKVWIFKGEKIS